jgi:phytoene/squalene synthetase
MQEFCITPRDIEAGIVDDRWRALMRYEIGIARKMMFYGAPLAYRMKGRFRPELCIIIQAGLRSLDQIERGDYDVFRQKPMLRPSDWLVIFYRSIGMFRGKPIRDEAVGVRHGSCHPATHINR